MNKELINKFIKCKNKDEILKVANENNIKMSEEDSIKILNKINAKDRSLSDEELKSVSGGCGLSNNNNTNSEFYTLSLAPSKQKVEYVFEIGQVAYTNINGKKVEVIIDNRRPYYGDYGPYYWYDKYHIKGEANSVFHDRFDFYRQ